MQLLDPNRTTWHITFGTFGARLHGGRRPTIDRRHNERGTPFVAVDLRREQLIRRRMSGKARYLNGDQREFIEVNLDEICARGGWEYRISAAAQDHVHLLCDVLPHIHGKQVRRLVKRWLTQSLNTRWTLPVGASWWAEGGSNKVVADTTYLNNAYHYIRRQRTTPP